MSTILGNPITLGGGGAKLNIDFGATPPSDTTKLWVPLAKKPDAVECKPELVFGNETFATELCTFDGKLYAEAQQNNVIGTKIYQICGDYGGLSAQRSIYWYDYSTGETGSKLITGLNSWINNNCSVSVGSKIYSFGGKASSSAFSYVLVYDTETETYKTVNFSLINNIACGCALKGTNIYVVGGWDGSTRSVRDVLVFDTQTDKFSSPISLSKSYYGDHCSAIFVGDYLYVVGLGTSISTYRRTVSKINLSAKTFETVCELPINQYAPVVVCFDNRNIYILGGPNTGADRRPSYKVDTVSKTYEELSSNFDTYSNGAAYGVVGSKVYILGGGNSYDIAPITNAVRSFTASSPLTNNHLFLQEDCGYDGLWTALKSKDTDFKVKVINAYLGDSNNIAQLTNAYLYDSKDLKWKSLSGESYVADMQKALNIMGVN